MKRSKQLLLFKPLYHYDPEWWIAYLMVGEHELVEQKNYFGFVCILSLFLNVILLWKYYAGW